jgi:GNAT superfamily N-acetyltransferase
MLPDWRYGIRSDHGLLYNGAHTRSTSGLGQVGWIVERQLRVGFGRRASGGTRLRVQPVIRRKVQKINQNVCFQHICIAPQGLPSHTSRMIPMNQPIQIRPVVRDDLTAWSVLWDGYNRFYGRHGETALPIEVTKLTWARFFDPYEPMFALVAEREGELIGLAHYLFHRSTTQIGPSCYLQDLFTAETARGHGVARRLIAEIYEKAKALGLERVYWQTYETNATAMRLYDTVAERSSIVVYRKFL